MAMGKDKSLSVGNVYACGNIIYRQLPNVLRNIIKGITIGQNLVIGNHNKSRNPKFMQPHPILKRSEQMADMQTPRGSITG